MKDTKAAKELYNRWFLSLRFDEDAIKKLVVDESPETIQLAIDAMGNISDYLCDWGDSIAFSDWDE